MKKSKIYQVMVGPAEAEDLLGHLYPGQRHPRKTYVEHLAGMMRNGEFNSQNGQTIVLSTDGYLLDGQHRMRAIKEAGVSLLFNVCVVDDADATYLTLDNGTKRIAADFIDCKNNTVVASLAKSACTIENTSSSLTQAINGRFGRSAGMSRPAVVKYANENLESLERLASFGCSIRQSIGIGASSCYAIALFLIQLLGDDSKIESFVKDMKFGTDNVTLASYQKAIMRKGLSVGNSHIDRYWLIGITLHAYEAYASNSEVTLFRGNESYMNKYAKALEKWRLKRASATEGSNREEEVV